jgi:hypothetical protein
MNVLKTVSIIIAIILFSLLIITIILVQLGVVTIPAFLGTTTFWVIASGVSTITFTTVAVVNMVELRTSRMELVHPRLSLVPSLFDYDVKTNDITGFSCLNLVNGGTVARDIEIDFSCQGNTDFLYTSSLGTNESVQIWAGKFAELGNNIVVDVKFKNMYNKPLHEVLSINIDSINRSKRKIMPVQNRSSSA